MRDQVQNLGYAMEALASEQALLSEKKAVFEKENAELIESISMRKKIIDDYRAEIKPLAIAAFSETGEKKMVGGIGIRESKAKTVYEYDDADALSFAKEKDMFLALDKKAFESAIPGMTVDFVTVKTEPGAVSVTFPKEIVISDV